MAHRIVTLLTGRNLPKIIQGDEPPPSILNPKTIEDFTRVVRQMRLQVSATSVEPSTDALPGFFMLRDDEQLAQFSRLDELLGQSPARESNNEDRL